MQVTYSIEHECPLPHDEATKHILILHSLGVSISCIARIVNTTRAKTETIIIKHTKAKLMLVADESIDSHKVDVPPTSSKNIACPLRTDSESINPPESEHI